MKKIFYFVGFLILLWIGFLVFNYLSSGAQEQVKNQKQVNNNLVLFYDKNLISDPPATWQEVLDLPRRQADIALGRADNVEYSAEILVMLMLQQGISWPDFDNEYGEQALKFYTQFPKEHENPAMIIAYTKDASKFANYSIASVPTIEPGQETPAIPELTESTKAVLDDMIESVAFGRKSAEQAVSEAAIIIKNLK